MPKGAQRRGRGDVPTHARSPVRVRAHARREALAALDVVGELVEARAGRRQHDGVAGLRRASSPRATAASSVPGVSTGTAAPSSAARDPRRVAADQQHGAAVRVDRRRSGAKSWPLPSPPAISTTGRPRPSSADARRRDGRALRVVDEQDAGRLGDPLHPVRQALEARQRARAPAARSSRPPTSSASAASALSALWRPTSARSARGTEQRAAAREPQVARRRRAAVDESPLVLRRRHPGAEGLRPGGPAIAHRQRARVVAVQHLHAAAGEDAAPWPPRSRRCRRSGRGGCR